MEYYTDVVTKVDGLYAVIPLTNFRNTPGVMFDFVPEGLVSRISSIDRVIHANKAISPGPVGGVDRPWYMHPHQDDNLVVMHGKRHVELYTPGHGRIEAFVVTPQTIEREGAVLYQGGAMLVWPRNVFHRIQSGEEGSASMNFAVHYEGFSIRTNFNIYGLDVDTGKFEVVRYGHEDQK
ncbi:MAG: hypothetical protein P8165_07280 [Deltaproteobacteria bacterium]|jgi:hypothetical protein